MKKHCSKYFFLDSDWVFFNKDDYKTIGVFVIENGKKVSLEYTVFLDNGMQIDTNVGEAPLVFVHGEKQVFPALEKALLGLDVGDVKKISLEPQDAYGPILKEGFREVELEVVPHQYRFVGAVVGVQDPEGGVYPIRIHTVSDDKAVLDFNHPLAGKTLLFDVKVVQVD